MYVSIGRARSSVAGASSRVVESVMVSRVCAPTNQIQIMTMSTFGGLYNPGRARARVIDRKIPTDVAVATSDTTSGNQSGNFMKGEVLDYAINLRTSRPGKEIAIPYELTLTESLHEHWHSSFHYQDRIHTSTPFARKLGLQDRVMPFSLVL